MPATFSIEGPSTGVPYAWGDWKASAASARRQLWQTSTQAKIASVADACRPGPCGDERVCGVADDEVRDGRPGGLDNRRTHPSSAMIVHQTARGAIGRETRRDNTILAAIIGDFPRRPARLTAILGITPAYLHPHAARTSRTGYGKEQD